MKNKQVVFNMTASFMQIIINTLITLFLTSYITETIGIEAYGFVQLSNTFVSYMDIISVSLNSFSARYVSLAYYKGNNKKANIYFNSTIFANIILTLLLIIPISIGIINLDSIINIPNNLVIDVKILFFLTFINYIIIIMRTAFNIASFVRNRLDLNYVSTAISLLVKAGLMILLFSFFGSKIYFVTIATIIPTIFLFICNYYFTKSLMPDLKVNIAKSSFSAIVDLISSGFWSSINSLGNVLNSGLDLIVTNQFLSAIAMGQLSIAQKIVSLVSVFISQISNVFQPYQTKIYAEGKITKLIYELKFAMKISSYFCELILAIFIAVGFDFLYLWVPSQNIDLIFIISILCITGNIVVGCVTPLYYVYTLTNKLRKPSFVTIINGIVNICGMLILLKYTNLGLYAIVITTVVCNFVVNFIWTPLYAAHCLKVKYNVFYPEILKHIIITIVISLLAFIFANITQSTISVLIFILKSLAYSFIFVLSLFYLNFSRNERNKLKKLFQNKLKKTNR